MLRILGSLSIFLLLSSFVYAHANACSAISEGSVNVRAEPNVDAQVVGLITPTNPAEITDTQNGWYQVSQIDFGTGWVAASVVTLTGDCISVMVNWNPFIAPLDLTGMEILFISNRDGLWNLYAMDASGSTVRQFTTQQYVDPVWSPDRTQAIFTADPTGVGSDIYLMSADGSMIRNLTGDNKDNQNPMWSPDGTQIAFRSMRDAPDMIERPYFDDNFAYIYVMISDGSNLHRVIPAMHEPPQWFSSLEFLQGWTSDGRIVFTSQRDNTNDIFRVTQLYSIDPDGSDLVNLTKSAGVNMEGSRGVDVVELSPDGSQITFIFTQYGERDLYLMKADGTHLQRLTQNTLHETRLRWSPDGTQIAFVAVEVNGDNIYQDIYLININDDGSGEHNLTGHSLTSEDNPQWSPDGTQLAVTSFQDDESDIYLINTDGTNLRLLTPSGSNEYILRWWG